MLKSSNYVCSYIFIMVLDEEIVTPPVKQKQIAMPSVKRKRKCK